MSLIWWDIAHALDRVGAEAASSAMDMDFETYARRPRIRGVARFTDVCERANRVLREYEARGCYFDSVEGWRIEVWQPERTRIDKILRLVAVDPQGIVHNIVELAGIDPANGVSRGA